MSGNGKSTLLWYLAQHHDRTARPHLHLDLDRDSLRLGDFDLLDALADGLRPHLPATGLHSYRRERQAVDAEKRHLLATAVVADIQQSASGGGHIENSPITIVAEMNMRMAEQRRDARRRLTRALAACLGSLAGQELVIFLDTYERVRQAAEEDFRLWLEEDVLEMLLGSLPRQRLVLAGREHLPYRADRHRQTTLRDWTRQESDTFLASYGLTDGELAAGIFDQCRGHPLLTHLAWEVWREGSQTGQPLRSQELRGGLNQAAATRWLFALLVQRLPPALGAALRGGALLRQLSLDALNALLPEGEGLDYTAYQRLLGFSFVQRLWGQAPRIHDLIRQTEDGWCRRAEPTRYAEMHSRGLAWYTAQTGDHLADQLYHHLALDAPAALSVWVRAIDRRRLAYDLAGQSALLAVPRLAERWHHLPAAGQAEWFFYNGELARFQDRLGEAEAAYNAALPIYRQIEARLGEANTRKSLGQLRSRQGSFDAAEQEFAGALAIYTRIEDRYSTVACLTYRGQHRLQHNRPEGLGDWGIALPMALAVDVHLVRQVFGIVWNDTLQSMQSGRYPLLAAGIPLFVQQATDTARQIALAEEQANTLALFDAAWRFVGALAAWHTAQNEDERSQLAHFVRESAPAIDAASGGGLGLVALAQRHLPTWQKG